MLGIQKEHHLCWETQELGKGSWRRGPYREATGDGQCRVNYLEEKKWPLAQGASCRGVMAHTCSQAMWCAGLRVAPGATSLWVWILNLPMVPSLQPLNGVGGSGEIQII